MKLLKLTMLTAIVLSLAVIPCLFSCSSSEEAKEIKRLDKEIAAMKKQQDIDLKYMQKERSEEYEEWKSMYAHEVAYLKVRRKSFKALQGDASAYPVAKQYFENYVTLFSNDIKEIKNKAKIENAEEKEGYKSYLNSIKKDREKYEKYLEKLHKVHNP